MDLNGISAETLETFKKATAGVNSGTGIHGADLSDLISLVPVNTPFRDRLARTTPKQGAKFAEWEVLMNVNNSQPNPATAFDAPAPLANLQMQDVTALYAKVGSGYTVTLDANAIARGYADAKAVAIFNSINQYKIGEDRKAIGGQNFALQTPAAPSVTESPTGGTIPPSTAVNVKVAVRSVSNFYWGGSGIASAQGSVTTSTVAGSTHSATATVTAVRGAVAYDWFVAGFYYTTTTVNTVVITNVPVGNAAGPIVPVAGLSTVYPTAVPVADASGSALDFNGLLASLAGDYATGGAQGLVTAGTGVPSGAYFLSLNGAPLTISGPKIAELDTINQAIYDSVQLSPDRYMVSSQQGATLSAAFLASGAATAFLNPSDQTQRAQAVLGASVEWYVNAITGDRIAIELNPNLPAGTIIATRDSIPFPNSNIANSMELRCQEDLRDYEYAASRGAGAGGGPRFDGEIYSMETFVNRAPVAMAVIQNIAKS